MNYQILGVVVGFLSGVTLEILATSPYKDFPALFPSQFINSSSSKIHLHHWILYFLLLLITLIWSYKTDKLFHPAVLFITFFLLGAIILNFLKFPDWFIFIK
jgi:hypothetical protein